MNIEKLKENKKIVAAVVIVLAAILAFGGYEYHERKAAEEAAKTLTLRGNVDLREVSLAFRNSDRIAEIDVDEGDTVSKGQVLAQLDTDDLNHQIAEANSQIAAQQAQVDKLKNGTRPEDLAQAQAKADAAAAKRDFLQRDYDRKLSAYESSGGRSISRQAVDDAKTNLDVAAADAQAADQANQLAIAGPRQEDIDAAEAQLKSYQDTLARLQYNLSQSTLVAPSDGVIRSKLLQVGDMASPKNPVFKIALNNKKWVRVYASEKDLGRIHEGQKAKVYIDSDPSRPIDAQIGYISSTAEFTPKNVQTDELRTALLYEVRAYVDDPDNRLRLGMPATVKIEM
jgi:HlyD family secretion protein